MTWIIRHNGIEFSSDDFLIEDLGEIEKVTEMPWSVANPLRSVKCAKAFLAAAMLRSGRSDAEVETTLKLVTLKSLKKAFEFKADEDEAPAEEEEIADPLGLLPIPDSSSGEPPKAGPRVRSVKSA